jgi:hypothetical protein
MRSTVADFFVGITSLPFLPDAVLERRPESRTYPNRYLGLLGFANLPLPKSSTQG